MRFVLLTLEYAPQKGGVATYYGGMVSELRHQGHEVTVVQTGLLSKWVYPHWFAGIVTMWKLLRREQFDFVMVGHILPLGSIAYLFRKKVPYIISAHGMDLAFAKKSSRKEYGAKKILSQAHQVIANSNFTAALAKSFGVLEHKISVLYPCPQPLVALPPQAVEQLQSQLSLSGKKIILSVGRLVARKGFDTTIGALPEILKKVPHAVLLIAGDGEMRENLTKQTVELGVQGSVRMLGAVENETLAALYQIADVFAMPCRAIDGDVEGFGTVYLEAGQWGVPSVAGKSGGANEAVIDGKTGVVVEPNEAMVAQAITHLLMHEDQRKELGEAAKRFAATFRWEKNIQELLKSVAKLQSYPVA